MTSKKKLGSKLASSVRQVKLQRGQPPAMTAKTMVAAKEVIKPAPAVAASRAAVSRPASKAKMTSEAAVNSLHPQRIWPD